MHLKVKVPHPVRPVASALALLFCLSAFAPAANAGQTINITHAIGWDIYGNGNPGTGMAPGTLSLGPSDPTSLERSASGNTVNITASVNGDTAGVAGGAIVNIADYGPGGLPPADAKNTWNGNVADNNTLNITGSGVTIDCPAAGANCRPLVGGVVGGVVGGAVVIRNGLGAAGSPYSSDALATGNRVNIDAAHVKIDVVGGMAYTDSLAATAKGNHVKLTGGAKLDLHAIGGMAQGETGAEASGNSVTVEKNSFVTGDIHGGRAYAAHGDATVEKNEVIIDSSTVNGNVFGAWADSGINSTVKAERNTVTIRGGAISGTLTVVGGQATGSTAHATGNTVNISGALTGTLVDVIGGRLTNNTDGTATGNTVNIRDIPAITGKLFGGETDPGTLSAVDFFSGNTLNLYSADFSVGDDLGGFEFLNFILPETVTSGVTILKLAGAADLTGVNIGIAIDGAKAPLPEGFEVTLIDTTGTGSIAGTPFMSAQARHGAIKYEITDLGSLKVALGNSSLDDGAKSWSEGYLASTAFLAQGSDFLTSRGLQAAQGALAGKPSGMESFAAIGGGKLRHETGSHVDVDGYNLIAGVTSGFITDTGKANLSAFFELGDGDYTSHNSFASGKVNGRGDTGYKGLGLMGRLELGKDAWLEGSLRGGKTDVDYRMDGSPTVTGLYLSRYDAKSNYFGAHLGVGETRKLSEADNLDVYLQFLWTHQGRDSATPPEQSGATLKFDAIDSKRVKVGVRLKHAFTPGFSGYAGLSYDHETSARASATLEGGGVSYEIKAPDMKGGTGAVEFGFSGRPMASQPLYLDLGVQGHGGQRQGVTASVRASYLF